MKGKSEQIQVQKIGSWARLALKSVQAKRDGIQVNMSPDGILEMPDCGALDIIRDPAKDGPWIPRSPP